MVGMGTSKDGSGRPRQHRGFAAMDPEKQRAIAAKGGRASHEKGTANEWDTEQAREAGRRGARKANATRLARRQAETTGRPVTPDPDLVPDRP
jgi:general stress protein YciG